MTAAIAANGEISTPGLDDRRDDSARTVAATTEYISFAVGDEQYGVNIMAVREIKDWSAITQLPNQPAYMRGVLRDRADHRSALQVRQWPDRRHADACHHRHPDRW